MKDYLQNWVFHFNPFTEKWAAIHRDNYLEYWSDNSHPSVLRSSDINTLMVLIKKIYNNPEFLDEIEK